MAGKKWIEILILSTIGCVPLALGEQKPIPARADLEIEGLIQPVEIIKDRWGISHIFAQNQDDVFFAQGFNVASDRLFQLELWRRHATGTAAEILGKKAVQRVIGARFLKFRGDLQKELNSYHPRGEEIVSAFIKGINAYVDRMLSQPDLLPIEFRLLGITPGHWTPEVVVSRHNGLYRNATTEVRLAQAVQAVGPDPARWRYGDSRFHHVRLLHPLSGSLREDFRRRFDLGPLPRGGNGETVNNTSDADNQTSGATFRIIADLSDWDLTVGTNAPGQSGLPQDPHYSDLLIPWVEGEYFPVYFSRAQIESAAEKTIRLVPIKRNR
jgi:penicillin amidase